LLSKGNNHNKFASVVGNNTPQNNAIQPREERAANKVVWPREEIKKQANTAQGSAVPIPNPAVKLLAPYNKMMMKDPLFREFYAENLFRAVSIFPKFTRNYSKNYKNVQYSFRKSSKSKSILY
jgi:hypothetical protein